MVPSTPPRSPTVQGLGVGTLDISKVIEEKSKQSYQVKNCVPRIFIYIIVLSIRWLGYY